MATLQEIAADVYVYTNRPDLVTETEVAIRKAIKKFHGADTFKRDLVVQRMDMTALTPTDPGQYRWSIPLADFPRYRRFDCVRYPAGQYPQHNQAFAPLIDSAAGFTNNREFTEVNANNIYDGYGYERPSYFMVTGNSVTVKSSWYVDKLDFLYYNWPEIPLAPTDLLTSWIASEYPEAIVEEASASVFKMIGKDDEHQRFQALFAENLAILRAASI